MKFLTIRRTGPGSYVITSPFPAVERRVAAMVVAKALERGATKITAEAA